MTEHPSTFANYRGVVPMLWVFFGIACIELVVVHVLVSLIWPVIAWPLSLATLLSIMWLIQWIRSWRRLPHKVEGGVLTLHMGSLRSFSFGLSDVFRVRRAVSNEVLKQPGTRNLVPIAYPNRVVELKEAMLDKRKSQRFAIRVDDPAAFDAAMAEWGVPLV